MHDPQKAGAVHDPQRRSRIQANGPASAGWWKRPGVARLPVRNKTPPPSRGLVNQIGRLARGPAARVPPLPHNDVWSTDRVSLWERVGVRAKTPRAWGRTDRFVPPLDLQPQTTVHRVHPQRRGSPDLRVRPLRAPPHKTIPWAAHDPHRHVPCRGTLSQPGVDAQRLPGVTRPDNRPESCRDSFIRHTRHAPRKPPITRFSNPYRIGVLSGPAHPG